MLNIFYEDIEILELSPEFFVSWLNNLCVYHKTTLGDLSLIFCSDNYLLELNKEHLDHDYFTDIITFNYNDNDVSGDLFISVDRVKENAIEAKVGFMDEINRVVAHGVLHLIGFNDKSEAEQKEMRLQENRALNLIVSRET